MIGFPSFSLVAAMLSMSINTISAAPRPAPHPTPTVFKRQDSSDSNPYDAYPTELASVVSDLVSALGTQGVLSFLSAGEAVTDLAGASALESSFSAAYPSLFSELNSADSSFASADAATASDDGASATDTATGQIDGSTDYSSVDWSGLETTTGVDTVTGVETTSASVAVLSTVKSLTSIASVNAVSTSVHSTTIATTAKATTTASASGTKSSSPALGLKNILPSGGVTAITLMIGGILGGGMVVLV